MVIAAIDFTQDFTMTQDKSFGTESFIDDREFSGLGTARGVETVGETGVPQDHLPIQCVPVPSTDPGRKSMKACG